jgi:hypothetical protein
MREVFVTPQVGHERALHVEDVVIRIEGAISGQLRVEVVGGNGHWNSERQLYDRETSSIGL